MLSPRPFAWNDSYVSRRSRDLPIAEGWLGFGGKQCGTSIPVTCRPRFRIRRCTLCLSPTSTQVTTSASDHLSVFEQHVFFAASLCFGQDGSGQYVPRPDLRLGPFPVPTHLPEPTRHNSLPVAYEVHFTTKQYIQHHSRQHLGASCPTHPTPTRPRGSLLS